MSEIAVLSDVVEKANDEADFIIFTLPKTVRKWYVKLKMPNGENKWRSYQTAELSAPTGLSSKALDKRREIIQEFINELAKLGFRASPKPISLFMGRKIAELILTKNDPSRRREAGTSRNNDVKTELAKIRRAIENEKARRLRK